MLSKATATTWRSLLSLLLACTEGCQVDPSQAATEIDPQARKNCVGAIGVVGPTRMNYGRIIPMVDYTAKVVGHMLGN